MFRALSIIAAVAALAVSAAPVASAGPLKPPSGTNWIDKPNPDLMLKAKSKAPARAGKVANLGAADDVSTFSSASGIIMSDGRICNPRWGC